MPLFGRLLDQLGHQCVIGGVAGLRRLDPAPGIEANQIDRMTRMFSEQPQLLKLRSAITLAEGVNVVDIAHDHRSMFRKLPPR